MPSALIRQVADYFWSNNFLDVFNKFFKDHAAAFVGAPEMTGGEHNLEYYGLFQLYLEVYEATLTEHLMSLDRGIEDFYAEVREAQDDEMDPYIKTFVDCLLASADYDSFYKVMVREGKKVATQQKKDALKAEMKSASDSGEQRESAAARLDADGKGLSLANPDDEKAAYRGAEFDDDAKSPSRIAADIGEVGGSPNADAKGGADYK